MNETNVLHFKKREEWRNWLLDNFEKEKEVWFTFSSSKEEGISYNDAVEEALCFGWIDGIAHPLDDKHNLRRFTPRRKGTSYSRLNIERLIYLDEHDMIHPSIKKEVEEITLVPFKFPKDIIKKLQKDEVVWNNYQNFSIPYKRIRISHIEAARSDKAEFKKRLDNFIKKTRDNKIFGSFGGADKYYR
jgi:uncharacterized protein YdeI (YjbR/CyaY-like superfamily)